MQNKWHVLLASQSPRRAQLLEKMDLPFTVITSSAEEIIPPNTPLHEIPVILAGQKMNGVDAVPKTNEIIVTADTLVFCENRIMGKPKSLEEAKEMLVFLSGKKHTVVTGVHLKSLKKSRSFSATTFIEFNALKLEEIYYYVNNYEVLDKAGAYAIQDWIGTVAVKSIEGEYNNVVGLPTTRLYQELSVVK